jgi:diguanylate cyclase (GGDEF)-like protein
MTDTRISLPRSNGRLLSISRRTLVLFGVIAFAWSAVASLGIDWLIRERTAALVAQEAAGARRDVHRIAENVERLLNRLQGLPAVLAAGPDFAQSLETFGPDVAPARSPLAARRTAWTERRDLLALSERFVLAADEMDVDIIWLMNASGDCVAASNFADSTSFIGTNYADRSYFRSARDGKRGRQYAMGRVTNVPGLFFSAPVAPGGRFLGTVALKIDLPRLAPWLNHPHAYVTDEYGVIILAADPGLEMQAVPGAAVHSLPVGQRLARYKRESFHTLQVDVSGESEGLLRVAGSGYPHVHAESQRAQYGISVHILAPVRGIDEMRGDALALLLSLSFSGIMVVALVLGARAYVLRAQQHRHVMEAKNASLNRMNEHLDHLARIDPLTECANRRHFQSCLDTELARSCRYGHVASLLVIDLDHFKEVNDRHGHTGGDEALRHFVSIARRELRSEDVLGRLGGEEFGVLLPETEVMNASAVAERIRRAVEAEPARLGGALIPLTASFGVACWKSAAESPGALMQRADAALYEAKAAGRNRVVVAGDPPDRALRAAGG